MNIGLLGGTFDPIHLGHVLLGRMAREQFDLDEIWFLPAGQPYFKEGKSISSRLDRLAMTRRALRGLPWARVSEAELRRDGRTYTYETVEELGAQFPEHHFSFIFGADCLEQMEHWKNPERILAGAGIIAAGRGSGADYTAMEGKAAALMEGLGGRIEILRMEEPEEGLKSDSLRVLDLSSTLVRERVKAKEPVTGMVPEAVEAYILRQGLYGGGGKSPSPVTAVLFDMDGTLLDTERLFIREWVRADGRETPELLEALHAIIGVTQKQSEAIIYQRLGADYPYERCRIRVDEAFRRAREEGSLPLKAGARDFLEGLWQQGYKLALATSTIREVVIPEMLSAGLFPYFDAIISGDDVSRSKPAPDIFLKAANALELSPSACLVIEDSYNGIRAAHAAGMRAIMVPDIKPPTEEMEALAERICPDLAKTGEYISGL